MKVLPASQWVLVLQLMVRGQSKVSKRAQIAAAQKPKTALTPEEQVDCACLIRPQMRASWAEHGQAGAHLYNAFGKHSGPD